MLEPALNSPNDLGPHKTTLVYKIDGKPSEVDVFQLSSVLEALGRVIREAYQLTNAVAGTEMEVRVAPFERGSFIMDIPLLIHQHAGLFTVSSSALIVPVTKALRALGLISDETANQVEGVVDSVLELVKKLGGEKPDRVEKKAADQYEFHGNDKVVVTNSTVYALYNNSVVHKHFYQIVAPTSNERVPQIETSLKGLPNTTVKIGKQDAVAVQRYSSSAPAGGEINENTMVRVLHPKSGNYGQTTGSWQFSIAGQTGSIRAKILDPAFLSRYANGEIRFHRQDRLRVRLRERQIVSPAKIKMEYEILEVLEYVEYEPLRENSLLEED